MSVLNNATNLFLAAAPGGGGGYAISRSLRFNSADSAYLSRTPASAGNRKTWTWAGWVKRSTLSTNQSFLAAYNSGSVNSYFRFTSSDTLDIYSRDGGGTQLTLTTSQVFRDPSSWLHIVLVSDTTQGTESNRFKAYVNGQQITQFSSATYPSSNADLAFNGAFLHSIGDLAQSTQYFNGYLADIHFIDGQALDPTSFGEFDATTGVWMPKAFAGSYGSQGWHLDFADNASTTTIGYDAAGSNDWTANNISVTAGAGNDSLVDVPVNGFEADTGAGGEVRGNYCTWNPVDRYDTTYVTLSKGNLNVRSTGAISSPGGTIGTPSSGKWYWEISFPVVTTSTTVVVGFKQIDAYAPDYPGYDLGSYAYRGSAIKQANGAGGASYGATYGTSDVIGVAIDADAGTATFYKNGASQGIAFTGLTGTYTPHVGVLNSIGNITFALNAGQRSFAYAAPSGFKALCTANLPAPTIVKSNTVMDVALYTGNGSTQTISGLGFSPDLVWGKSRSSAAWWHILVDTVRGAGRTLSSNATNAEIGSGSDIIPILTSNGFELNVSPNGSLNENGTSYAAWCWDAGNTTVTDNTGSIQSTRRTNASAGISIVSYTGNGTAGATVGHGLNVAPQLLINKRRSSTGTTADWAVWHKSVADISGSSYVLFLNTTDAALSASNRFNSTAPTSSVFTLGNADATNYNGGTFATYCFAPVAGYSSFGSYTGNGSSDGPFVYTGFRPRWIMIKRSDAASVTIGWRIIDTARMPSNSGTVGPVLAADTSGAENAGYNVVDILSNGFKVRVDDGNLNANNGTYVYCAFAESPFQYARAR